MTVSPWKSAKAALTHLAKHPGAFVAIQLPLLVTEIIFRAVTPSIKGIEEIGLKLLYASLLWVLMFSANFLVQSLSVQTLYSIRKSGSVQFRGLLHFTGQRIAPLLTSAICIGLVVLAGMLAFILPGLILFTIYLFVPNFITVAQNAPHKTPLMAIFRRSSSFARAHASGTLVIVAVFAIVFGISFALEDGLETISETYAGRGAPSLLFDIIDIAFSVGLGMCLQTWVAEFFIESVSERKTA